jgi:hypothetical protein
MRTYRTSQREINSSAGKRSVSVRTALGSSAALPHTMRHIVAIICSERWNQGVQEKSTLRAHF